MKFIYAAINLILITTILNSFVNVSFARTSSNMNVYFSYNSSSAWMGIKRYGSATINGNILQLTGPEDKCGWAAHSGHIPLVDSLTGKPASFSTHFSFIINSTNSEYIGDGLAFFLSPDMQPISSCGGNLGLFSESSSTNNQKNQTVAVEFDTGYKDEWDPSFYHVGIDVNSIYSVVVHKYPLFIMTNGTVAHAWVSYSADDQRLNVSLSYQGDLQSPGDPILSYKINLNQILPTTVAVGFSASNYYAEVHQILSWEFNGSVFTDCGDKCPEAKPSTKEIYVIAVLCTSVAFLLGLCCVVVMRKQLCNKTEDDTKLPKKYSHKELVLATSNFASKNKLGEGGFGPVFKGYLRDSCDEVAVKQRKSGSNQGSKEFESEVEILSKLKHPNLVQLFGWCEEKSKQLLVYKYMPNGSLNSLLFDKHRLLLWPKRYEIVLNLADSLFYLQAENECNKEVVHRDIKPDNVLLDSNLEAKLSDFGLARLVEHGISPNTTNAAGSWGYVAPELFSEDGRIKPNTQSDIYSFGIVLLEVASGRRPVDLDLMRFVWEHYDRKELLKAADARLRGDYNAKEIERVLFVGLWCAHPIPSERPVIQLVRMALKFEDCELPILPNYPHLLYGRGYGHSSTTSLSNSTGTSMCSSQDTDFFTSVKTGHSSTL